MNARPRSLDGLLQTEEQRRGWGWKIVGHPPGPLEPDPERLSHPHRQADVHTCRYQCAPSSDSPVPDGRVRCTSGKRWIYGKMAGPLAGWLDRWVGGRMDG